MKRFSEHLNNMITWRKHSFLTVIFVLSFVTFANAQQERFFNWYFGNQAGLSFSGGAPVALTNGAMSTTEGCASISDASGNLMFYTNGINVWNSAHALMTNGTGLTGHQSSTQSAIIVQKPLSNNIYYIFTADSDVGPNGIRYSEVDMSLSGGLGAVTANKNVLLQTPSCEKITAVRHCNNRDVWIVSHDWGTNGFRVWLVTPAGVNTTPVTSSAGSVISGINQSGYGQLKANPDGNKLLAGYYGFGATNGTNKFELYDFNNSTGIVSNGITLATETGAYGCEFSPNGRVAYGATNQGRLVQFNLCAGSTASIQASKVVIGVLGPFIGSLQLGPDGKIYVSRNTTSLSVINNPNTVGTGCGFVNAAIPLAGRSSSMGLPNLASFYIRSETPPFTFVSNCTDVSFTSPSVNVSTNSCANATNAIQGAQWNFGDPASGASNLSTQLNPSHTFSTTGSYNVRLILDLGCYSDTLTQTVTVTGFNVAVTSTPAACGANNGTATATPAAPGTFTYLWSNGATGATATGLAPGLYTVTATESSGCTATANVNVTSGGSATLTVNTTNALCNGASNGTATATGSGGVAPYTFSWSNGSSAASVSGLAAGNYSVTMTDNSGCVATQSFVITQPSALTATVTAAPASCSSPTGSASATPSGGTAPYSYLWSDGTTGTSATGLSSGSHTVTITDANGCTVTRTVTISQPAVISGTIAATQITCNGANNGAATVSTTGGTTPITYLWSNGATTASVNNLSAGNYTVTATDASGCSVLLNTSITQPAAISATVNVNNSTCGTTGASATISASGGSSPYSYAWSSGSTSAAATGLSSGNYSVTITDASGCSITENFTVNQPAALSLTLNATVISCFGANDGTITSTVSGGTAPYTYLWSNTANTNQIQNLSPGPYTLTVTDAAGCSANQSIVITQPAGMNLSVTTVAATCGGTDGTATVAVTGGLAPYTYSWNTTPAQITANAINLSPGAYSVQVTDANGCVSTANTNIANTGGVSVAININSMASCFGGNDGSLTAIGNGGATPYTYSWSNGTIVPLNNNLLAGTYTCTVTDANGCTASETAIITEPAELLASVSSTQVTCYSLANGTATVSAIGGLAPYTYNWSNGVLGASANNLAAGSYTVNIIDQNNCSITSTVNISAPAELLAVSTATALTCAGSNDGAVVLAVSGGTPPYSSLWSDGQTGISRNGLSAGTYNYTITDGAGCQINGSVIINAPVQLQAAYTVNNASCYGNLDGEIFLNVSGGTSPFQINWSNGSVGDTISGLAAGNYAATITDVNGCQTVVNAVLTSPDSLSLTYNPTSSTCSGSTGSLLFNGSGGQGPYQWSLDNGVFQSNPFFGSLTAGIHIIVMRDANQCSITRNAIVGAPVTIGVQLSNVTDVNCFGNSDGSAQAIVSGGTAPFTYTWSSGESGNQASQLIAGENQITVTDAAGCSAFLSFTLNAPDALVLTSSATPVSCYGGSDGTAQVQVSGGSGNYTYVWETGETTASVQNMPVGYFDITVTDDLGCLVSDTIFISQPAQPILLQTTIIPGDCGNGAGAASVLTTGGTAPYTYSWNSTPIQTTQVANNLQAGTYTVTVTDANGCIQTADATLENYEPVTALVQSVSPVTCFGGNDGAVSLTVSGGETPYVYQWGTGPQSNLPNNLPAGTYNMTIIDVNGCTGLVNFIIPQPDQLIASAIAQDVDCFNDADGRVILTVNGGIEPYSFDWSNGLNTLANDNLTAGVYSCVITDLNGCTVNVQAEVEQPEELVAVLDVNSPGCSGISDGSLEAIASGGSGFYTYQWSTGQQAPAIDGLAPGQYSVNVIDENACMVQLSAELTAAVAFSIYLEGDTLICEGDQSVIEASASGIHNVFSYTWDHGVTGPLFAANPQETTTYYVTVQDSLGCLGYESITVHVNENPSLQILADDTSGCAPFCAKLSAESETATFYNWTIGDSLFFNGPSAIPCFDTPGIYPVRLLVKDAAGCTSQTTWDQLIEVYPSPVAAFVPSPTETTLDQPIINFTNESQGASEYTYFFGDPDESLVMLANTAFSYKDTGSFEVTLQVGNEFGCTDQAVNTIHIGGFKAFYVPKAFTPNADGINDVFLPKASGFAADGFEMRIFDRWGHEVFYSNSWEKGWDGTIDGVPVPVDLYVCKIRYYDKAGNGNDHIGAVTVTE
jgi:gliding motility-associated-like protein